MFTILHEEQERERETNLLSSALSAGWFAIDHSTFDFYAEALNRPPAPAAGMQLAQAVVALWPSFRQQPAGRSTQKTDAGAVAAVWRQTSAGTAVLAGDVHALVKTVSGMLRNLQVQLALDDPNGARSWGDIPAHGVEAVKSFRETGLPWTIRIAPLDETAEQATWASRRNLLLAGFALMALVIAAASYAVFRAVSRELSVARLQSDFVAAVSRVFLFTTRGPAFQRTSSAPCFENSSEAPRLDPSM